MPSTFARPVRVPPDDHHAEGGDRVGNRAQESDGEIAAARRVAHDLRHPETHGVERDRNREIHGRQQPHSHASHGVANRVDGRRPCQFRRFFGETRRERALLLCRQPSCVGRLLGKQPKHQHAEDDRRHSFDDEQPLPSREAAERRRAKEARLRSDRRRCRRRRPPS